MCLGRSVGKGGVEGGEGRVGLTEGRRGEGREGLTEGRRGEGREGLTERRG